MFWNAALYVEATADIVLLVGSSTGLGIRRSCRARRAIICRVWCVVDLVLSKRMWARFELTGCTDGRGVVYRDNGSHVVVEYNAGGV